MDKYITCNIDNLDANLVKMHEHRNTKSFQKKKNSHCRDNFSMPLMKRTRILKPIDLVDEAIRKKETLMFTTIEGKQYDKSTTFKNFLDELDLAESDYILAIQSILKQPMVFLK